MDKKAKYLKKHFNYNPEKPGPAPVRAKKRECTRKSIDVKKIPLKIRLDSINKTKIYDALSSWHWRDNNLIKKACPERHP